MPEDYGIDDAALEQRIAELDDDQFDQLVARTRPPHIAKGTHVPGVGNQPTPPTDQIRAAEQAGDWKQAFNLKAAQLNRLLRDNR